MKYKFITIFVSAILFFSGCQKKDSDKEASGGMKCGAGKCGANMFDGNSALEKKKKNMLLQMREDDTRRGCVLDAKTTKDVYECVREKNGKKLTTKCGQEDTKPTMKSDATMKCEVGKCS